MKLGPGLSWCSRNRETHICAVDPEEVFTSWQTAMSGRHHPGIIALSCPQNKTERHWVMLDLFPDTSASLHHIREIQPHFEKVPALSCHPFQERHAQRLSC